MDIKWVDLDIEDRIGFDNHFKHQKEHSSNLMAEKANSKTRFLTFTNAGGVVTVVTYLGAFEAELEWSILFTLICFLLGLITNGLAIFLAEGRFVRYFDGGVENYNSFTKEDSEMTLDEYNRNVNELAESVFFENLLEFSSGVLFLLGCIFIITGMICSL